MDNLPCTDLQNIDTRSTGAKDVILIFADLKNKIRLIKILKEQHSDFTCQSQKIINVYINQFN